MLITTCTERCCVKKKKSPRFPVSVLIINFKISLSVDRAWWTAPFILVPMRQDHQICRKEQVQLGFHILLSREAIM